MRWLSSSKKQKELQEEILAKQIAKEEAEHEFKIKTIQNALSKTICTPDAAELANKAAVVIFVYNDLMKKRRDHAALEPLAFCGDAYTIHSVNGWYRKKDQLPICMKPQIFTHIPSWSGIQKNAHAAKLKGEVFLISTNKLIELDLYHDNGVQFIRQRIDIEIPYEEDVMNRDHVLVRTGLNFHKRKAWAYLGNPEYWWGKTDLEGLPFARAVPYDKENKWKNSPDHFINNVSFVPMPIFTPKKTWKELYYYHARN